MHAIAMGKHRDYDDRVQRRAARVRLYRRLAARMRLQELATTVHQVSQAQRELERLKSYYLPMWSWWCYLHSIEKGLPGEVPFTDYMRGSMREFDETDWMARIDAEACRLIDQAVDELVHREKVAYARAVLAVRYLNERIASVFRSGRLVALDPEQADELCDHVERELVPIVKRKGILL